MIALAALVFRSPGVWEWGDIMSVTMKLLGKEQSLVLWCFSASLLLSSCGGAGPECGSLDMDIIYGLIPFCLDPSAAPSRQPILPTHVRSLFCGSKIETIETYSFLKLTTV